MSASLKQTTIKAIGWSAIERFSVQGIQFFLSLFIARMLSPSDYGLIAMLGIFMSVAQCFIDSGFSNALIQKQGRTSLDYSTVFYFNIVISVFMYMLLFLLSPFIATFYNQPQLDLIVKLVGLNLVISSLSGVQRAILTIELDFKRQAFISLIAVIVSGGIAVWMANSGYGVWVLVAQGLLANVLNTILLWITTKWTPLLTFSIRSFKELFGFGSKLLAGGLLVTLYTNSYTMFIGKYFSTVELGNYNRAFSIAQYPSSNLTGILVRVTYPVECQLQNNDEELQKKYFLFIRMSAYIVFPMMIGLWVLSESFIRLFLTDKWISAVPYLQIMCFAYMFDPIMRMSAELLNVKHRSDYSLKSEIVKKIAAIIILLITIPFGVKVMCYGLVLYSISDIFIITIFTRKILPDVKFRNIIRLLFPIFLLSMSMGILVFCVISYFSAASLKLLMGMIVGIIYYYSFSIFLKFDEINQLRSLVKHLYQN